MRQRKIKSLHDEDKALLPNAVEDSASKTWLRRLESLVWIGVAYGIAYFSNLLTTARDLAYGWPFFLAVLSNVSFVSLFLAVIYIQPIFTGRHVDLSQWETEIPKSIYLATFLGVISYTSIVWMLWPAYHIFSFPIVFLEIVGVIAFIGLF